MHQTFLVEHVTPYNPAFENQLQGIRQWLAGGSGAAVNDTEALMVIYREVLRQAGMLAFNDTFWVLAVITAVLVLFTPIFKRPARTPLPMEGMH